jgi:hypothetical protein
MPLTDEISTQKAQKARLNDFDPEVRRDALDALNAATLRGDIELPASRPWFNLHCHSFFSYNGYGMSPSALAWMAKTLGLELVGLVDFDVLDGLDEFLAAGQTLGIKTCVSVESRVYVPEFSRRVINSPGEPGISYHMGVGFSRPSFDGKAQVFLNNMRRRAAERNRELVDRVTPFLSPLDFDYTRDVEPLTPRGNATERHICQAYAERAAKQFATPDALRAFWTEKLGPLPESVDLPDGAVLQGLIRAKTMKQGGVGYVQPGEGSFPELAEMNRFVLATGALPTLTWLDGTSDGEQALEELAATAAATGAVALNIIPDRNFTAGQADRKLENLYEVVALARRLHWPVVIGTEMNSPGLKQVDDLDSVELAPVRDDFYRGAHIVYGHSVLLRQAGLGYLSEWAKRRFERPAEKNDFYEQLGRQLDPKNESCLSGANEQTSPKEILAFAK